MGVTSGQNLLILSEQKMVQRDNGNWHRIHPDPQLTL